MTTNKQPDASEPTLEARIAVLEALFVRLAQAGATECILENGFKTISERLENIASQMAPLRVLAPDAVDMKDERIQNIIAALVSPAPKATPTTPVKPDAASVQMRSAP